MHCSHCHSLMTETNRESSTLSTIIWYQCPVCNHVSLQSEPKQLSSGFEETLDNWAETSMLLKHQAM